MEHKKLSEEGPSSHQRTFWPIKWIPFQDYFKKNYLEKLRICSSQICLIVFCMSVREYGEEYYMCENVSKIVTYYDKAMYTSPNLLFLYKCC